MPPIKFLQKEFFPYHCKMVIVTFFAFFIQHKMPGQNRRIDSILQLVNTTKNDTLKVKRLVKLCWEFKIAGQYGKGMDFGNKALELATILKYKKGMASAYGNLANIFDEQGNLNKALEYHLNALRIFEELGDKQKIATARGNIGIFYLYNGEFEKSLEFQNQALALNTELKNKKEMIHNLGNIGNVYDNLKNNPTALEFYFKALQLARESGETRDVAATLGNIGSIYNNQGNFKQALSFYQEAVNCFLKLESKKDIAINYCNLASVFIQMKNLTEAENCLNKSLEISREINSLYDLKITHELFSRLYELSGKYESALSHYKKFISARDSIFNEENTKKSVQQQMQYDFDKKSSADSIKNAETKKFEEIKHHQEISKQKTFTYGGIAGFLIMIVIAGISFVAFKNKKKANIEIQRQKELVEEKQKEILDSIYYARRIQRALITSEHYINKQLRALKRNA